MTVSIVGFDIAKNVFQVHAIAEDGSVVARQKLRRGRVLPFFSKLDPCLIGIEACASAHHWARELIALGHDVRLIPASYVRPYVKRQKNDAADAEAICEALTRPSMRFVPVKSPDQQSVLVLHRTRDLLVRQRTSLINALRGHLAEFGIIAPVGAKRLPELLTELGAREGSVPDLLLDAVAVLVRQLGEVVDRIREVEAKIAAWARTDENARLLATIPGIGPITSSAIAATVTDVGHFRSGRHFAAWLGLVPRQNSSGGKDRLGGITKKGDKYLRRLLVVGATTVIQYARQRGGKRREWAIGLLDRRPTRVVHVALANKMARMAWAMMVRKEPYREGLSGAV